MYPKPFYKSKTFWLAVAQVSLNVSSMLLFLANTYTGADSKTLLLIAAAGNALLGLGHLILRFYTSQPITPVL